MKVPFYLSFISAVRSASSSASDSVGPIHISSSSTSHLREVQLSPLNGPHALLSHSRVSVVSPNPRITPFADEVASSILEEDAQIVLGQHHHLRHHHKNHHQKHGISFSPTTRDGRDSGFARTAIIAAQNFDSSSLVQFIPGLAIGSGIEGIGFIAIITACAACCVYVGRKIWKWWKTFDLRESWPFLARWLLKQGWDQFEAFPVVIKIFSISQHREPCRLRIRMRSKIYETKLSTADGKWGSTTRMMVPQGCDRCEIEAVLGHREGKGKVEGSYSFSIWNTMLQENVVDPSKVKEHPSTFFGVDQHMTLMNSAMTRAGTVHIKFDLGQNLEDEVPLLDGMNPSSYALSDLLLHNMPAETDIPAKGEYKLQALSNVLRGTLSKGAGSKTSNHYFALVKRESISKKETKDVDIADARKQGLVKTRWHISWWPDERTFRSKPTNPPETLSLLQCTSCRAHPTNPTRFIIRYAAQSQRHELQLKRVSLERDVWVEGLSLAIAEVHNLKRNPGDTYASRKKTAGEAAAANAGDTWSKLTHAERSQYWRKYWADQGYSEQQIAEWIAEKSEIPRDMPGRTGLSPMGGASSSRAPHGYR